MDSDSRFPVKVNLVKVDALRWNHNRPLRPRSCWQNGYQFTGGDLVILCNINILNGIYELCCVELRWQKSYSDDSDQCSWRCWAVFGVISPPFKMRSGSTFICNRTKFARSNVQSEGSAWFCVRVTDLWTSRGLCQDHDPVTLIPSQISLQKQTDVDGCHDVWMLQLWKIYSCNMYTLFIPFSSPWMCKKKRRTKQLRFTLLPWWLQHHDLTLTVKNKNGREIFKNCWTGKVKLL